MSTQLFLGIITAALIILLAFLIPVILQIRKTAKSAENFFKVTRESLTPLLSELKESVERLNRVTGGVEDSIKNVQHLAKAIGEIGTLVDGLNNFVKQTGLSFSVKTASLGVGIKTALSVLAKGLIKKTSNKNEDA